MEGRAERRERIGPDGAADEIASLVTGLGAVDRRSRLAWAAEVGRRVVEVTGEGQGPALGAIARHPALPMSGAQLYRCVAIHRLLSALPKQHWQHVGLCHVRAVLGLPRARQVDLLAQAEWNQWTVRELSERVGAARSRGVQRGRPPQPKALRTLRALARLVDRGRAFDDLGPLASLDPRERIALRATVDRLALELEMLRRRL